MKKYALTLRYEFNTSDDPAARMLATGVVNVIKKTITFAVSGAKLTVKLQEVFEAKPPRKVNL